VIKSPFFLTRVEPMGLPPDHQVAVLVVGKGPSGRVLELRHNTRGQPEIMDEVRMGEERGTRGHA